MQRPCPLPVFYHESDEIVPSQKHTVVLMLIVLHEKGGCFDIYLYNVVSHTLFKICSLVLWYYMQSSVFYFITKSIKLRFLAVVLNCLQQVIERVGQ